jgi:hypothetical protein
LRGLALWAFSDTTPAAGAATVTPASAKGMPSRLVRPVVSDVAVPTALPPCPALRGEPCRAYVPFADRAG